ncbi:DUF1345 domain-containing protein [Glycomyces sp. A-F 0318]|uniref:DUF1345 domain-containing protein n=1 Tax=Glycomyces amatae TaxID=2881355 RepID=UPI001E61C9A6|nr:DUF1345 domain-containing protein [Glycomyces amatae]MCD0446172.1 DUF1345 domain-containing protein [Glycomyces amatae]
MTRRMRYLAGQAAARAAELALVLLGLQVVFAEFDAAGEALLLLGWDLLAAVYLAVGALLVRRSRHREPEPAAGGRGLLMSRYRFAFTLAASLTGVGAAVDLLTADGRDAVEAVVQVAAIVATGLAWLLLHSGYARFYAARYAAAGEGFAFPGTAEPGPVDMAYFAFAVGTSFATSDVVVTSRVMRWHVTVHSIASFAYNTAVIALAVSVVTRMR